MRGCEPVCSWAMEIWPGQEAHYLKDPTRTSTIQSVQTEQDQRRGASSDIINILNARTSLIGLLW